jgi:rhodanese-related sulfurtransferase
VHDLAPDAETTVIVNCAGRTRSIIGAQALINAGIPNRVVALRNGTMGWHLAGFELDRGQNRRYPEGTPKELTRALAVADRVAARFGVRVVETAELEAWRLQADERTLYLLDVRDPAEYGAGHLPGSRPAPGGQLVQALDYFIGVRGARVVLVDDTGVRATMTAHWLIQMGLDEVYMLRGGLDDASTLETGDDAPPMPEPEGPPAPQLTPSELQAVLEADDAVVLDVGYSKAYRKGHIPGSSWALRTRIKETGRALPQSGTLVIASSDGRLARLAVAEVRALTAAEVKVLEGGTDAWKAAGLALEADNTYPEDDACIDVWLRAYDRNSRVEEKMNEYLAWEIDLVNQIGADGDTRFRGAPS